MTRNTEADLHTLLDGLTDGEQIKATWVRGAFLTINEGPVSIGGREVWCRGFIRWIDGSINSALASIEVARDEELTATRDDEKALKALVDSSKDGEVITAEWRNSDGSMTLTGPVQTSGLLREVDGYTYGALRLQDGALHSALHSVAVRRTVVQRWEREGCE